MALMNQQLRSLDWPIRVYYEDTDAGGVVYYANYLKFMERGRTEWLRSHGIEQDGLLAAGIAFMVRSVQIDYLAAARFDELLTVATKVERLRGASIVFTQKITRPDGHALCTGQVRVACVNLSSGDPMAIPAHVKGALIGER